MSHESVEPGPMPFHVLKQITNDFSEERSIGSGAYGSVYMGMYEDGRKVAVKVLHSMPGFDEKQFETEFHNLESLHHRNIVGLIGYCHETFSEFLQHNEKRVLAGKMKMALCMEYIPNGSLDKHISDEYTGHKWHTRYKIIKGICSGLQYLHEELENPLYHLDLKPANILLDEEMEPKIGDFGLSRFFADQQTQITSACIGTLGYLPPEYIQQKAISIKFDIYSLGVVITKIISGSEGFTKLYTMNSEEFIELVHANWRSRLQNESRSDVESSLELVRTCTKIALRCLEDDRHTRPTIGEILTELNEKETVMQFPHALSIDGGSSTTTDQVSLNMSTDTQSTDAPEIQESESLRVEPGHLRFPFKPNKLISRVLHLTNKTDKKVAFRCLPEASRFYMNSLQHVCGILPPETTCLFVVTIAKQQKPPSDMDLLAVVIESCKVVKPNFHYGDMDMYFQDAREQSGGNIHEVTLKCEYVTEDETPTSKRIEQTVKMLYWNAGLGKVFSSDVHPTEPWILTGYSNGSIAIWDYKTQERVTALKIAKEDKEPGPFSFVRKKENRKLQDFSAKFIARKQWLAAGDGFGYIHVHTYEAMLTQSRSGVMSMDKVNKFYAHAGAVTSLAVHPNEPFVLSASTDKQIKLWDWENGWKSIRIFKTHKSRVSQVIFNPRNNSTFASISVDGTILIWDISSTIPISKMNCGGDLSYAIDYFSTSDDFQCLVAVCQSGKLSIWDLQAEECVRTLSGLQSSTMVLEDLFKIINKKVREDHHVCCVGVVDSIPGSPMLATVLKDNGICLYDYMTHSCKRVFYFKHGRVHHIAYIKEINSVAVAFYDGLAIIEMPS